MELNALQKVPLKGALSQGGASSKLAASGGVCVAWRGGAAGGTGGGRDQLSLRPGPGAPWECPRAENQGSAEVLEVSASSTWSCPHGALRELHKDGDERKFGWTIKAKGCFQRLFIFLMRDA